MRVSLRRPRASDWAGRRAAPASGRLQIETDGDQERQQAQQLRRGEAAEQAALLAVGCRRIAPRAFQQAAEDIAHAATGPTSTDSRKTGPEQRHTLLSPSPKPFQQTNT